MRRLGETRKFLGISRRELGTTRRLGGFWVHI